MEPASSRIPNEVWDQIIKMVAPKHRNRDGETSLLPQVLARRPSGVKEVEEERQGWKDVGSLFRVSKKMMALTSPVFYSFVSLSDGAGAIKFFRHLRKWPVDRTLGVTALEYTIREKGDGKEHIKPTSPHPVAAILSELSNLHSLRIISHIPTPQDILVAIATYKPPLVELEGVNINATNSWIVPLALSSVSSSLRHLTLDQGPAPTHPSLLLPTLPELVLPELRTLVLRNATGDLFDVQDESSNSWHFLRMEMLSYGGDHTESEEFFQGGNVIHPTLESSVRRLECSSMLCLALSFATVRGLPNLTELAFRIPCPNHWYGWDKVRDEDEDLYPEIIIDVETVKGLKSSPNITTVFVQEPSLASGSPPALRLLVEPFLRKFTNLREVFWIPGDGMESVVRVCWTKMLVDLASRGIKITVLD